MLGADDDEELTSEDFELAGRAAAAANLALPSAIEEEKLAQQQNLAMAVVGGVLLGGTVAYLWGQTRPAPKKRPPLKYI